MKSNTEIPEQEMQQFLEQLDLHQRFLQQERNVERDWNQVTSVCLTVAVS
jgi:hypothetical protein